MARRGAVRAAIWGAAVGAAGGAWAAGMPVGGAPGLGPAFAQVAVAPGVWRVATPAGRACVAGRALDVAGADYRDGAGAPVAFAEVRRSRGASVQWIAEREGALRLRVQLKYPVDAARGVVLEAGGRAVDLAGALERSGDSLVIRDAGLLAALAEGGGRLTGWSEDTGRRIADALPAGGPEGLADCLAGLAGAAGPLPGAAPGLRVAAAPTAATRVGPAEAEQCGATVTGVALHRGRLVGASGFFAPTDAALVGFDRAGAPVQVHLPGTFEALRRPDGTWRARLSVAADANVPMRANAVKGCLGDAWVEVCAAPSGPGEFAWGDCAEAGLAALVVPWGASGGASGGGVAGGGFGSVGGGAPRAGGVRGPTGGPADGPVIGPVIGPVTGRSVARFASPPLEIVEARGEPGPPRLPDAAVPVPSAFGLLAAAAAGLAAAARRRRQSLATRARSTITEHCA